MDAMLDALVLIAWSYACPAGVVKNPRMQWSGPEWPPTSTAGVYATQSAP
jgi:hypothetical protein